MYFIIKITTDNVEYFDHYQQRGTANFVAKRTQKNESNPNTKYNVADEEKFNSYISQGIVLEDSIPEYLMQAV